ncbi:TetR/AcrR family transcriptional regulator [Saccharothrix obliqua]|uniref:TetR/AcrR family transcriptional regulator n=1 Tax=Saccharothrix obliqua TaxID=2861747 RepID=UPI001C5F6C76|nr:TetR/AcrR family transcriptional regulator [Saccharothrix obliqua]MBW4718621.1 TetR/AcrR family transcriptional regulator [Saccharothrix obliqua]
MPPPTLVWMRDRGGRPALTEERIVRAATRIADAEGIDALSMRRVAAELGTGTTSLYRHIVGKDELIELMVDAVYGEDPLPEPGDGDWRGELADIARAFRRSLLAHPWLAQQASRRPALGPNVIARSDHTLSVAAKATPDATKAGMIVDVLNTYVLGSVSGELAEAEARRTTGMTEDQWRNSVGEYVAQVVESGRYPHFNRRVIEAGDPDAETRFEFGLFSLLAGLSDVL